MPRVLLDLRKRGKGRERHPWVGKYRGDIVRPHGRKQRAEGSRQTRGVEGRSGDRGGKDKVPRQVRGWKLAGNCVGDLGGGRGNMSWVRGGS